MEIRYIEPSDPMWEDHESTVDPACSCYYTKIRNGLWKTIAIRREIDVSCPVHHNG